MNELIKFPRTRHIESSRFQPGDEDLADIPFSSISGKTVIVEEKVDGANCAVSFSDTGELLIQSRGHYLTGGYRERHFDLLKKWAAAHSDAMLNLLGTRYIMFGEWLYAKHTIYYNALPHYFMEFDILDRETGLYLDTPARKELLSKYPFITSVPLIYNGIIDSLKTLPALTGNSSFIAGNHIDNMKEDALRRKIDPHRAEKETDKSSLMEGLYIKIEEGGFVRERMKYVRSDFLSIVTDSESHWVSRPIIPNRLIDDSVLWR